MQITFIVGSFEAGKDGVGDYSRKLGDTLIESGNRVTYIAWNDPHISESDETDQSIRFGQAYEGSQKVKAVRTFLQKHHTDCISLQYVAYAYDRKGLTTGLRNALNLLGMDHLIRHIMIHEIWVGAEKDTPLKHKLLGQFQKDSLKKLIKAWNPQCIHTQAPFYGNQLVKAGIHAHVLPLFSNIDIYPQEADQDNEREAIQGIVFGTIPSGWDISRFVLQLKRLSIRENKPILLRCIGRNGSHYPTLASEVQKESPQLRIEQLGELSAEEISKAIQAGDFGVGLARPHLLCKSGTAAAFDEHGLPIMCARAGEIPEELKERRYFQVPLVELEQIGKSPLPRKIESRKKVTEVAEKMLADIQCS